MKFAAEMILIAAAIVFASEAARARHNDFFVEVIERPLATENPSFVSASRAGRSTDPAVQ